MAGVNTAPKLSKKRKLGKNKKKSWRASKVEDVEEFLEDERRQIRTGGLVSEKSDESLFVLEPRTQKEQNAYDSIFKEPQNKKRRKDKPLKCLALLQPDPHSKTVRKADKEDFQQGKRSQRVLERLRNRSTSKVRVAAQKQRLKSEVQRTLKRQIKKQLPTVDSDIWADDEEKTTVTVKPPTKYYKKPSALKATVIPHPGASVNPSYEDHQDLLYQAHVIETAKIKKENKIYNALDGMFPKKEDAPTETTYLVEMSAGLVDDSEEDDEEEEDTPLSVNPPVRREDRKTKKQKRIQREQEEQAKLKAKVEEVKRRERMVLRIPTLKSDINKSEREKQRRASVKQKKKEQEPFQTKRLNKIRYEDPDPDLKLSTELVASLREIKPEGHLIEDMYKSFQKRNIIEPREKQKYKRKYKLKKYEKKSHKNVTF